MKNARPEVAVVLRTSCQLAGAAYIGKLSVRADASAHMLVYYLSK